MDIKKEDMAGGMMDDMAGGHNPQALLRMLAEGEKMEAALYTQIAQLVPSEELKRIILHRARHEQHQAEMLSMLAQHFGGMHYTQPGPPMPYSAGEGTEKK